MKSILKRDERRGAPLLSSLFIKLVTSVDNVCCLVISLVEPNLLSEDMNTNPQESNKHCC